MGKIVIILLAIFYVLAVQARYVGPQFEAPLDEVKKAQQFKKYSSDDFVKLKNGSSEDYFRDMDKGITLAQNWKNLHQQVSYYIPRVSEKEAVERVVKGRNNWIVWTGGNDRFWDEFSKFTFGNVDFLKTLSNHKKATTFRSSRWEKLGLINEPCYIENQAPRVDRYGLYLDLRDPSCTADPFEDKTKYPGVPVGSRGKKLKIKINGTLQEVTHEVGSYYGYGTGIIGLRLFTNPEFDQEAANKWDPERYYNDPSYYNDPDLVKPYRVGMSCAFCHVGVSPVNPPKNLNAPDWSNLSSTVGTQYFWVDRLFAWNYRKETSNLIYQLLHSQRPGTIDTSLISSDQINNSRTMNAVYDLPSRIQTVADFGLAENMVGAQRKNAQFNNMLEELMPADSPLRDLFVAGDKQEGTWFSPAPQTVDKVITPRVLKDGSDSVGALGALNRVYVNIGLYSEEWMRNFTPVLGTLGLPGLRITPFKIDYAQKYSGYWQATEAQTADLGLFLLTASSPDLLKHAPGGEKYLLDEQSPIVQRGKEVFAQNCAACHSSKQPQEVYAFFKNEKCEGENYLKCWENYFNYTQTNLDYKKNIIELVKRDDFLQNNYLSIEQRVPVNVVGTQVCSSLATNAIEGSIWDNFSSQTYKNLPSIKLAPVYRPDETGENYVEFMHKMPAGGRGFLRPPSLISIWSTAPFFNNNSLGPFRYEGTVEARMDSFMTSMDWLLNPEKRGQSKQGDPGEKVVSYQLNNQQAMGVVDVFQVDTFISIPRAYIPGFIYALIPKKFKKQDARGMNYLQNQPRLQLLNGGSNNNMGERLQLGPIPAGVPINLLSNINFEAPKKDLIVAILALLSGIESAKEVVDPAEKTRTFMRETSSALLKVSTCDDFIVNKGHYFATRFAKKAGTGLAEDKSQGLSAEDQKALIEFLKHM